MNLNLGNRTPVWLAATAALSGLAAMPAHAAILHWSGDVDDTATIRITGRSVNVESNMKGVRNERHDFRGPGLPDRPVHVELRETDGRGRVRLVEQPSARNNYTAVVRIKDKDPGQNHYDFTLQWDDARGRDGNGGGWRDRRG